MTEIQEFLDGETLREFHEAGIWLPGEREELERQYKMQAQLARAMQGQVLGLQVPATAYQATRGLVGCAVLGNMLGAPPQVVAGLFGKKG